MAASTPKIPITCPKCGVPAGTAPARLAVEKPFGTCGSCGAFVARPLTNEWVLLRPEAKAALVGRIALHALTTGLVLCATYSGWSLATGTRPSVLAACLWLAGGCLLAGGLEGTRLTSAIRRSRRRMVDPMYLAKLVQFELAARRPG